MTTQAPVTINWTHEATRLTAAVADDAEWYAAMARELARPTDQLAADIGCGAAGMAVALADALPPRAFVVGIDGDAGILDAARRRMVADGVDDGHIRLIRVDLDNELNVLPSVVQGADIIWASASIHHLADQQGAINALARLLARGGRLALVEGGLPSRHLPWDLGTGEPGLECRLTAAEDRWFARMRAGLPNSVPMPYGWCTALRRAGLRDVTTKTSIFERPAPLPRAQQAKVIDDLGYRVDRAARDGELDDADLRSWTRLLDPHDAAWLGGRDDLYSLTARSVHIGRRM